MWFCQFPFPWIYYFGSNKSTGKETGKTHLCAVRKKESKCQNTAFFLVNMHRLLFYNYKMFVNFSGPILQMRAKFFKIFSSILLEFLDNIHCLKYVENYELRTPRKEIAFTARPKIQSQSQIFRYGRSIFCLPRRPKFSDFFDLCLHWVSVVPCPA